MRVFVTGATGFVGSHLLERLARSGHTPVCLVRNSTSSVEQLQAVEIVRGSITEPATFAKHLENVDAVVHLAGGGRMRPAEMYRVNAEGTAALVGSVAMRNPRLQRFIYVSTVAAQGPSPAPAPRPLDLSPAPVNHYGMSKLRGEAAVLDHADTFPVTIFRPAVVYGPGDVDRTLGFFRDVNRGTWHVIADGQRTMSVIHVADLADALLLALEQEHKSGSIFPLDDGDVYTEQAFGEILGDAIGKKPRVIRMKPALLRIAAYGMGAAGSLLGRRFPLDPDRFKMMRERHWACGHEPFCTTFGWRPHWSWPEGARATATWYRENGWL